MNRILRWLPALGWAVLIAGLSHRPQLPAPPLAFEGLDKLAHGIAFGALAWLIAFGAGASTGRAVAWCVVGASLYGAIDEWHQSFIPPRQPDPLDWLADSAGALLAGAVWLRVRVRPRAPEGASEKDPAMGPD